MLGDAQTHEVVANQADTGGTPPRRGWGLGRHASERHGHREHVGRVVGVRWTQVRSPLPTEERARAALLLHECFHRIQPQLELEAGGAPCEHLDGEEARVWLFLEWRALEHALLERGAEQKRALKDASRFRAHRRARLSAAAAQCERRLEVHEGLAEYTGLRLANESPSDRRAAALVALRQGPERASLTSCSHTSPGLRMACCSMRSATVGGSASPRRAISVTS